MTKKEFEEKEGEVTETLSNGKFRIRLDGSGKEVMGYVSGKMRKFNIRVLLGDRVKMEFNKYDENYGRITYRYK